MKHSAHRWLLILALLAAGLLLFSCSKENEESESGLGPHPQDWMTFTATNADFHGWPALADSANACRACHGQTLHGSEDVRSCYDCHAYLHTQVDTSNRTTHQSLVAFDVQWNIKICATCHGTDFSGGQAAQRDGAAVCTRCHLPADDVMRLDGCNVCHTDDPELRTFWKVPFGMDSASGPGAHPVHVTQHGFSCRECHPSLSASGHPHALPADVSFSRAVLANLFEDTTVTRHTHVGAANSGNAACSNVYCHSDGRVNQTTGRVGPPVAQPQWVGGGLVCGGCHRTPPPQPHAQLTTCGDCHTNVDPASDNGSPANIIFLDDSTHINGHVNF